MADIKISQSLFTKTETTITMRWTANVICDILWWSVDGGETWTELNITDGKGGSYTIGGLDPNANYSVKTKIRRKGTSLTATSTSLSVSTFDYPHAEEMPNFTIGERVTIGIYNPMNRSVTVSVIGANNSEVWSEESTGQSVSGLNEDLTQEMLYQSIPNAKQGSYKVKVTSGSNVSTKDGGIYSVNENLCRPVIASVSYQDTDASTVAITGNDQDIVRNRSVVRYTASGLSAKHSASIVSCSLEVNGDSYSLAISGSSATGGNAEIDSATDVDAVFTVTDSRGISSKRVMTINILDWHFPSALVTLERQGNYKTETDLTVNAVYPSVNGHNTITITYSATKEGDSSPSVTGSINDGQTKTINLDNAFAWSVEITLTDRFGVSSTYGARVSKGTPTIFYDRKKESVGVGMFPTHDNSLEVAGSIYMQGHYTPIGNVVSGQTTSTLPTTTQWQDLAVINPIRTGVHLLVASVEFPNQTGGRRGVRIFNKTGNEEMTHSRTTVAQAGGVTRIQAVGILTPSVASSFAMQAFQNSGSSLANVVCSYRLLRII